MRVLVTRPWPDGERTAATLRARGYTVFLCPLMKVVPIAADLAGNWSAVIVTSANALRALGPQQVAALVKLPLFAVGQRSAEAAREAGFADVYSADGDADDLVRLIAERTANQVAPHLYLAGEDRAADIEAELGKRGIKVGTAVVYRNVTTGFPPDLIRELGNRKIDIALHFSRRSAENYVAGARAAGLVRMASSPGHFCLSAQAAEPLQAAGVQDLTIAARPDEASLLALLPPPRP